MDGNQFGIELDDAVSELATAIEEASNFLFSEFNQDWVDGEAYYAGKCNLPTETGRSSIVKTEARDVIRALMPNLMRILLQSRMPVEYKPSSIQSAKFCEQQGHWINQQFLMSGGYKALYSAILESMKLKSGPVKIFWDENPKPEHISATGLTAEQVTLFQDDPDIVVDEVKYHEQPENQSPTGGQVQLFDIKATRYYENGKMGFEAFPIYEFFCARNASDLSGLHGHRRSATVSEALEMGLTYENWRELDDNDPRSNDAAQVEEHRRGYQPNQDASHEVDLMNHRFLLTEAYCEYDMDGDGVAEKYVFYLGGTTYTYLHHEKVEDFCIAVVNVDPQPFTVIGRSIIDLTKQSTDNETSLLRTIIDNAHIANNPRPAADPTRVNFSDLMNNAIGAPIRTKGSPDIKHVDVPFTGAGLFPLLEWMEKDAEIRVGVTKAARGLDPDALQSTDKNAVLNTINLSQGQVELMARNVVETGLIPLFGMALRIATRHMPRRQMLKFKGAVVPMDISYFDPNLVAVPNVGLGTASREQKALTLQFTLQKQEEYMTKYGLDNPFVSLSQVYNTLEDLLDIGGIVDAGRYFNYISPDLERQIAQMIAKQQAAAQKKAEEMMPLDPGRAVVMQEQLRNRIKELELFTKSADNAADREATALRYAEENDIRRDDMVQDRIIRLIEIGRERENERIRREQEANNANTPSRGSAAGYREAGE